MEQQQGVVSYVGSKEFKGRVYHSFALDGVKDTWFRTGTVAPLFTKGNTIAFKYDITKYGNDVDVKSIEVLENSSAPIPKKKVGGGSGASLGKDDYWRNKEMADVDRQKIISYQAATNIATNIVVAALQADILPLPSKKGDKFDALCDMVERTADDLVVRYANAPARVDQLVSENNNNNESNHGVEINDE